MKTNHKNLILAVALAALTSACATVAPAQLVGARDSFATASAGLPGKLTPSALYDAKQVLDQANKEFEARGDTTTCRDYAYIAQNKVELAEVMAGTEQDRQTIMDVAKAGAVASNGQPDTMLSSAESR
jgi:hypothetical protein